MTKDLQYADKHDGGSHAGVGFLRMNGVMLGVPWVLVLDTVAGSV